VIGLTRLVWKSFRSLDLSLQLLRTCDILKSAKFQSCIFIPRPAKTAHATIFLCDRIPNRPQYGSCTSVRPSVRPSVVRIHWVRFNTSSSSAASDISILTLSRRCRTLPSLPGATPSVARAVRIKLFLRLEYSLEYFIEYLSTQPRLEVVETKVLFEVNQN